MADLGRSARLPYYRIARYLTGGPVRFKADERRRLAGALDRHEAFALVLAGRSRSHSSTIRAFEASASGRDGSPATARLPKLVRTSRRRNGRGARGPGFPEVICLASLVILLVWVHPTLVPSGAL
jgi:hypothetical protein